MKVLAFILTIIPFFTYAQHTLVLTSGEKIDGIVTEILDEQLTIYVNRKPQKFPMQKVSSIFFKEYVPYDGTLTTSAEEKVLTADGFTVKYQIKDRNMIRKPKISLGMDDHGTVVCKIIVDRYGNIMNVEPGQPGSTTTSEYLMVKATTAVQSAKFDENLTGPLKTEGTVTIVY